MDKTGKRRRKTLIQIVRWGIIIAFLALWQIGASAGKIDPFYFSSPWAIILDFFKLFKDGFIFRHAYVTLVETILGFIFGALFGGALAVALNKSQFWLEVLDPILMVIYGIPRIALAPLFILWFGLGISSKVVFAFFLVFFIVFYSLLEGLKSLDKRLINSMRVMGASKGQIFRKITLPYISPWLFSALKSSIGMSLLGAVLGEYIGGNEGIGWMITYASNLFRTTRVFSGILVLVIIVLILNKALALLEKALIKWNPQNYK